MITQSIDELARTLASGLTLDELREKQGALLTTARYVAPTTPEQQEALRSYWEGVMREPVPLKVIQFVCCRGCSQHASTARTYGYDCTGHK